MGLDNGIVIKANKEIKAPFWVKLDFYNNLNRNTAEVCYWRKCYGLRRKILDSFPCHDEEAGGIFLCRDDVEDIAKIIQSFCDPNNWEKTGDSIWQWQEIKWTLLQQWINLHWLARYMKHNDVEVYFYDSY